MRRELRTQRLPLLPIDQKHGGWKPRQGSVIHSRKARLFLRTLWSGQSLGRDELIEACATDVVSERTGASTQFDALFGVEDLGSLTISLRARPDSSCNKEDTSCVETVPGIPEDRFNDHVDEFGCTQDLIQLHKIFSYLPDVDGDPFVDVPQLRDVLLRTSVDGPIDDETLNRWMDLADGDRGGMLSFVDFARVYFSTTARKY